MPDWVGYIAVDAQWRIVEINAEARRLLQSAPDVEVGLSIWTRLPAHQESVVGAALRRVVATGVTETVDEHYSESLNAWYELRIVSEPAGGVGVYFTDITSRHESGELVQLAVDLSEVLVSAVSVDAVVTALALMVVPRLADWSLVSLVGADSALHDVASWHSDPARADTLVRYSAARMAEDTRGDRWKVRGDGPVVVASQATTAALATLRSAAARALLLDLAPESSVTVPFRIGDAVGGVLTLCRGAARAPISEQELACAVNMCRRAALAVDNAQLYAAVAAHAAHERSVARTLQDAMLTRLPQPDGMALAVRYRAAAPGAAVGGDWYDAMESGDGVTTVTIGDVMGHDVGAAALMGQLRTMLRAFAWDSAGLPSQVVSRLDRACCEMRLGAIATLVTARIDRTDTDCADGSWRLRWTNAGHPPPVLLHADGTTEVLPGQPDLLLGVRPDLDRHDHTWALPPASTLLLYTDGLVENRIDSVDVGVARLAEVLHRHHRLRLGELLDAVLTEMVGEHPGDDVALLAVQLAPRVPADDPAGPATAEPRPSQGAGRPDEDSRQRAGAARVRPGSSTGTGRRRKVPP